VVHTVLIVDDEEPVRRLLRDTLELDGYLVDEAADAISAQARIAAALPDCIVLDVMMPGMSGIDLLKLLKGDDATAAVPVIMLTAADDDNTTWAGWANGASCYVPKPFDLDHLLDWVARLVVPALAPGTAAAGGGHDLPDDFQAALSVPSRARTPADGVAQRPSPVLRSTEQAELTELTELYDWDAAQARAWSTPEDGVRVDELRTALVNAEIWVAYQPIVGLGAEDIVGVEALARWEHPHRGELLPAEFVPLAERSGLMVQLGPYIIEAAIQQVAEWNVMRTAAGLTALTLAVNVAPSQVTEAGFGRALAEMLARFDFPPASLIIELAEPALMRLLATDQREVRDLLELGVSIAFDDFAAASTSLSFLQRFHVDVVKIDRSHVRSLERDADGDSTVAAIISIAHRLGRAVVAEGVETPEQAEHLRRLGCEYAQGYLYGFPASASQVGRRLLTHGEQNGRTHFLGS
jgi:EAL domain-containing protein (putative c-di-GMP-specific phosphodiesterase class I)